MLRIVEVKGKDAREFLHRVTAGSVKSLVVGQGRAGVLLNGQSRVLAQFDLVRMEEELFLLAAPSACVAALAEALEAAHFSEDLGIRIDAVTVSALRGESRPSSEGFVVGGSGLRWPSPVPGFVFSEGSSCVPEGWDFSRIGALVPWAETEWAGGVTPALEAGMLPWIDREKGCYPGQEVVELSLNVGHPARILIAVEGSSAWEGAGITSSAQEKGKWRGLVRVPWAKKDFLPPGFSLLASHW